MAATLAHEINQPLSAIKAYLQGSQRIILRDDVPRRTKVRDALLRAVDQTDRAGEVVRRLRQFAKPNDGVKAVSRSTRFLRVPPCWRPWTPVNGVSQWSSIRAWTGPW